MSNTISFIKTYTVVAIELENTCGHTVYMTADMEEARRRDHKSWYCTVCGSKKHWPQESDLEKIRRERDAAMQREETLRQQRKGLEDALETERKAKARLKKRVANGVCPCCTRSFTNLRRHMATKHPNHAAIS